MSCKTRTQLFVLTILLSSSILFAQPLANPPRLIQLTKKAGYMFSGTVLSVQRMGDDKDLERGTVAVTFHVDRGIRGIKTGQTLTIREWAGLWNSRERYRPGEQVFLFLYPPSRLGLTSPVSGELGRFAIGSGNRVSVPGSMADELPVSSRLKQQVRHNHTLPLRQFTAAIRRASEE